MCLAMTELNDDWGLNQILFVKTDELTAWAKGEVDGTLGGRDVELLCSVDGMIHSVKGTFGLRIDGVDNVKIDGLKVANIHESSPLGYSICGGTCERCAFESRLPYSEAYAGNWAHAISIDYASPLEMKNIYIDVVESDTGRANGITLWPGVDGTFDGEIHVSNIAAGTHFDANNIETYEQSYGTPNVCGIQVYEEDWGYAERHDDRDISSVTYDDDVDIRVSCMSGGAGCWHEELYTMHGDTYSCDGQEDDGIAKITKIAGREMEGEGQAQGAQDRPGIHRYQYKADGTVSNANENKYKYKSHLNFVLLAGIGIIALYWVTWICKCNKKSTTNNKTATTEPTATEVTPLIF